MYIEHYSWSKTTVGLFVYIYASIDWWGSIKIKRDLSQVEVWLKFYRYNGET